MDASRMSIPVPRAAMNQQGAFPHDSESPLFQIPAAIAGLTRGSVCWPLPSKSFSRSPDLGQTLAISTRRRPNVSGRRIPEGSF